MSESRREFLRGAARYMLVGAVAVGGVWAAREPRGAGGQPCRKAGLCLDCAALAGCGLPAAVSMRQTRLEE